MIQYIPLVISGCMLLLSLLTFLRIGRKDNDAMKESLLKANLKLDQVCNNTNETRNDMKTINTTVTELDHKVVQLEGRVEAAFREIDYLKRNKTN